MKQAKIEWQQDQPLSSEFDDVYFSREDGIAETEYVFLQNNGLPDAWKGKQQFVIGETGFGTGLNFLTTVLHWLETAEPDAQLYYYSVEKYPLSGQDIQKALSMWPVLSPLLNELLDAYPPAVSGFHCLQLYGNRVSLVLMLGDAQDMLKQMQVAVNAWYLDGFAPSKNPDMWTAALFKRMAQLSHQKTSFSTFTAAGFVRRGLAEAGFKVRKVKGFGDKREMLAGEFIESNTLLEPLPWFHIPEFSPTEKRAIVIGAGIAGVSTAWSLARRGWQVDIFEKHGGMAHAGSGNPLGVLIPRISLDDSAEVEFYTVAYFYAISALQNFSRQDDELNWQQTGVLQLASSRRIRKQIQNLACDPGLARTVSKEQAGKIAGIEIQHGALFYPMAGTLTPSKLCQSLLALEKNRIQIHYNSAIRDIDYTDGRWRILDDSGQAFGEAEVLVLANAEAVIQFQPTGWLDVQPARGQVSYLSANKKSQSINTAICYEGYITPQIEGQHVCGASFISGDTSTAISQREHQQNLDDLNRWLPGLFDAAATGVEGRAALRAVTPDRMPLVGPVADRAYFREVYGDLQKGKPATKYPEGRSKTGLYVNTGHGARGLTSGLLAAEILAGQINNEPMLVSRRVRDALNPARFIIRALKKGV